MRQQPGPADTPARTISEAERTGTPAAATVAQHVIRHVVLGALCLVVAAGLFVAYEHFKVGHQRGLSLGCLLAACGFALVPLRAVMHAFFELESRVMHLAHGVGGLLIAGLVAGGAVKSGPVLTHAAIAPFAIMGAAQAIMHQDHPRNAKQAEALRRFATSLPEVEQFTRSGDLTSPQNAARAVAVLSDLIGKAQALGQTELDADPGFQAALRQATTRFGLTLGLDSVDRAISSLASNPAAAKAVPELRRKLAAARTTVAGD